MECHCHRAKGKKKRKKKKKSPPGNGNFWRGPRVMDTGHPSVTRKKYTINTITYIILRIDIIYISCIIYYRGFLLSVRSQWFIGSFLFSPHLEGQVRHDPDFWENDLSWHPIQGLACGWDFGFPPDWENVGWNHAGLPRISLWTLGNLTSSISLSYLVVWLF